MGYSTLVLYILIHFCIGILYQTVEETKKHFYVAYDVSEMDVTSHDSKVPSFFSTVINLDVSTVINDSDRYEFNYSFQSLSS